MQKKSIDPTVRYAQSSSLVSRDYPTYRKDMKKKAIAELEIMPWLEGLLRREFGTEFRTLRKSGSDAFLWFLRSGAISRDPDFIFELTNGAANIEFQYADKPRTDFYDFKLSKVSKKVRGKRIPKVGVLFLYVLKDPPRYALIAPDWIAKAGEVAEIPAWRTDGYRVPATAFESKMSQDPALAPVLERTTKKIQLLEFQHRLHEEVTDELSWLLQTAVDERKIVSIMPEDLRGFFQVCFILYKIERRPANRLMWISFLASLLEASVNSRQLFEFMFSLDFLYFAGEPSEKVLALVEPALRNADSLLQKWQNASGIFVSDVKLSPFQEAQYCLWSLNALEDMSQEIVFTSGGKGSSLRPVTSIYDRVRNLDKIVEVAMGTTGTTIAERTDHELFDPA
ncbi:MAG: hypothetical protein ACRD2L_14490 [Terriglobia bacterium]